MIGRTLVLLAVSLISIQKPVSGQGSRMNESGDRLMMNLSISYYGDLELEDPLRIEPGLMIDYTLAVISNRSKDPRVYRQLSFKPSVGFYKRKDYHTGFLVWSQIGYKVIRPAGLYLEVTAGPGYLHTFYNAPVYVQEADGSFTEKGVDGDAHVIVGGELALGWDFYRNSNLPIGAFASGGLYGRYPHNSDWVRHKFLKFGLLYTFTKKQK